MRVCSVRPAGTFAAASLAAIVGAACSERVDTIEPLLAAAPPRSADPSGRADVRLDFGEVAVGASEVRSVRIENVGRALLTVAPGRAEPPFAAAWHEPLTVPPTERLELPLRFSPIAEGPAEAVVTIESDGGSLTVLLRGLGIPPPTPCTFLASPVLLEVLDAEFGLPTTRVVRAINRGEVPCTLASATLDAGSNAAFALGPDLVLPVTIDPFSEVFVPVVYTPVDGEPADAVLTLVAGEPEQQAKVTLRGTAALCEAEIAAPAEPFGTVALGDRAVRQLLVRNTGGAGCTLWSAAVEGEALTLVDPPAFPRGLAPGASLPLTVAFAPVTAGETAGRVTVDVSDPERAVERTLSATGAPCGATFVPSPLDFGNRKPGETLSGEVRIVNGADYPCTLNRVSLDGDPVFALVGAPVLPRTIAPGEHFAVTVRFSPDRRSRGYTGALHVGFGVEPLRDLAVVGASIEGCPGRTTARACAPAPASIYLSGAAGLDTFDPVTGVVTSIGAFTRTDGSPVDNVLDLALDAEGALFGVAGNGLFVIDPLTAKVGFIGTLPTGTWNDPLRVGLAFDAAGRLFVSHPDGVFEIDPSSAALVRTVVAPGVHLSNGDLQALPSGELAWIVRLSADFRSRLVRIATGTGDVVEAGLVPGNAFIGGLGWHDALLGFLVNGGSIDLDPVTAEGGARAEPPRATYRGAASRPPPIAPEPVP